MSYEELEQRILKLFTKVTALALESGTETAVERLDQAERTLRDRRLVLVVMGEFSRGKSSLLNAYLKEPGLFPVHSYVSTRLVTTARQGPEESVTVTLAERPGRAAEERRITRAEIALYASETCFEDGTAVPDADRATALSISLPNDLLAQGLVVVDTPGIGGVHRGHTAAAVGMLSAADAVLYVTDAQQQPHAAELAFITDVVGALRADENPERLVFAVTKSDLVRDPAGAAEALREKLRAVPGLDVHRTAVVPVSARHRLLHLTEGDPEHEELSRMAELEKCLAGAVTRSGALLRLGTALAALDEVTRGLLAPVEETLAVLATGDEKERDQLVRSAEQRRVEATRQEADDIAWGRALRSDLARLSDRLCLYADAELADMWRELRASYRSGRALLDDPQMILDTLARRLAILLAELAARARAGATDIEAHLADRTGTDWHSLAVTALPLPPLPGAGALHMSAGTDGATLLGGAMSAALEGARLGAAAGGKLGEIAWSHVLSRELDQASAVLTRKERRAWEDAARDEFQLAAMIGTRIGAVVGATIAFARHLRFGQRRNTAERVQELDRLLAPWEREQLTFLHDTVRDLVTVCEQQASRTMADLLARRRAETDRAVSEIESALHIVGDETAVRRHELTQRRTALNELRASVAEVAAAVTAFAR